MAPQLFEEEVAFFNLLVVANGNLHDGTGDATGDSHDVRAHLTVAGPGFGGVAAPHPEGGQEREDNDRGRYKEGGAFFHGARQRPKAEPRRMTSAIKSSGTFQR